MLRRFFAKAKAPSEDIEHQFERDQQTALMAAISDGVLAVDLEGAPLFFNSRFAMLVGDRDFQSRSLWKTINQAEVLKEFQLALTEGKQGSLHAVQFDLPTGRHFYSVSVSPLRKPALREGEPYSEEIYGAVGIFHDVTELKRAEQIRIDFVANVSHELRTPLTSIKGYADTLIQDVREGKPIEPHFLEVISRNTDRLMSLITDLLDLSSIESTGMLNKSQLSTDEITARVIKQIHGTISAKNHRIVVACDARTVIADPARLEQVLVNLLDNAVKYTPAGGEVQVRWEHAPAAAVLLKVIDSGPGIHPEHHSRLFERFYRVDKARSREMGGTGLGLAIVKHIMQRHDGTVWVESAPGKGATFICRFPSPPVA